MMQLNEMKKLPLIDCHIHYPHPEMMPGLIEASNKLGLSRFNIVCTPDEKRLSLVPDALHLKAHYPDRVFVFGGLNVATYFQAPKEVGQRFADQIDHLFAAGCDGVKMIEGKPQMRKMLPIPDFDSDNFAPYWEKAAKTQTPILFHVNDPEEFWDAKLAPEWAFERGWFYGDGTFINNEAQYSQIFNVLSKYPDLKIIFAHFFFLSDQLSRLANLLDRFPNICIDLTPGIEMYRNFARNIEGTREFFLKYQDRILFGTDIGAKALLVEPGQGIDQSESQARVLLIRNFLEADGDFQLQAGSGFLFGNKDSSFQGLCLPTAVLEKIYTRNFESTIAKTPRPVNSDVCIELCTQIEHMIEIQGSSQPGVPGDPSVVQSIRSFFEQQS
jgi:predicted TIM-barrel fold metal-dependent hydrolase